MSFVLRCKVSLTMNSYRRSSLRNGFESFSSPSWISLANYHTLYSNFLLFNFNFPSISGCFSAVVEIMAIYYLPYASSRRGKRAPLLDSV
jgi:hypothetical protein